MRHDELKTIQYLEQLKITPHEGVTKSELKEHYLALEKEYAPYSRQYYDMKDAYDYLYDHMGLLEEALMHYLKPETDVVLEAESVMVEETVQQETKPYIPLDKISILSVILSLISPIVGLMYYFIYRKRSKKCARTYLLCGIIGFGFGVLLLL